MKTRNTKIQVTENKVVKVSGRQFQIRGRGEYRTSLVIDDATIKKQDDFQLLHTEQKR